MSSELQRVVENLAITDGLTLVLNLLPGNKLSVASRMWPDAHVVPRPNNRQCTRSRLRRR